MRNCAVLAVLALSLAPAYAKKPALNKDERVRHALDRLTFGPRPGDFERVRKMGVNKWISLQLHPERIAEDPSLEARLRGLDTLRMSPAEMAAAYPPPQLIRAMAAGRVPLPTDPTRRTLVLKLAARARGAGEGASALTAEELKVVRRGTPQQKLDLLGAAPPERLEDLLEAMPAGQRYQIFPLARPELRRRMALFEAPQQVVAQDLNDAKLLRAVYSERQLEEVLTDFWFNHFNVFLDKGADRYLVTSYERDAIRPHVLGRFKDLLLATARSPAMLFYLDNWQSAAPDKGRRGRGLNENYGRELLELHTLGVDGGYTQKDVIEVARCFTGWTIRDPQRGGDFYFNSRLHDSGEKVVLGVKIPAGGGEEDGLKVIDILVHHPSTARFISRKLAQRFVSDDAPPALVEKMARTFLKKDGDIREVLETMFRSREFWARENYRVKMKSPLELVASAVRACGGELDSGFALANLLTRLGQPLYRKLEPTGYSNRGADWMNTSGLLARMNFAVALASNRVPGVKVDGAAAAALDAGAPEFQRK